MVGFKQTQFYQLGGVIPFLTPNSGYLPAEATQSFTVQKLTQTIDFPPPPGGSGGYCVTQTLVLSATADSGLPVSFRSDTADICTVSGDIATLLAAGQCSITAFQSGNDIYASAEATQSFTVSQYTVYLPLTLR